MIITIKYPCKYRLSFAQNYVFSGDKCFNSKTNREIKQVYNNGSIGFNICGKFYSLKKLKPYLEKIPKKEHCPFWKKKTSKIKVKSGSKKPDFLFLYL